MCKNATGIANISVSRSKRISPVEFGGKLSREGLLHTNSPTANLAVTARLLTAKRSIIATLVVMNVTLVQVLTLSSLDLGY